MTLCVSWIRKVNKTEEKRIQTGLNKRNGNRQNQYIKKQDGTLLNFLRNIVKLNLMPIFVKILQNKPVKWY